MPRKTKVARSFRIEFEEPKTPLMGVGVSNIDVEIITNRKGKKEAVIRMNNETAKRLGKILEANT